MNNLSLAHPIAVGLLVTYVLGSCAWTALGL